MSSHFSGLPEPPDALSWNLGRARAAALGPPPLPGYDADSCRNLLSADVSD